MQIRTINYHPDYSAAVAQTAAGKTFPLQLFVGGQNETINIALDPIDGDTARNPSGGDFTTYGHKVQATFHVPRAWLGCTITVLHYANMVMLVCEGVSPTSPAKLFKEFLAAFAKRETRDLPAFYGIPLVDNHKLKPFGLKLLAAVA